MRAQDGRSDTPSSWASNKRPDPASTGKTIADVQDLEERAEHLQQVLGTVLDYVGAVVTDTDHVAPGGSIDRKYLLCSDVAGDVAGSIANAADDLAAGRAW
jgi:hypothetical protein